MLNTKSQFSHNFLWIGVFLFLVLFSLLNHVNGSEQVQEIVAISIENSYWKGAVMRNDKIELIADRNGNTKHDSFENINKIIGRNFKTIQHLDGYLLEDNQIFEWNGSVYCKVNEEGIDMEMTPEDIYSNILKSVQEIAFQYLNVNISNIFISVPEYFTPDQRVTIRSIASHLGLNVVRFLRDPVTSAVAFNHLKPSKVGPYDEETIFVVSVERKSLDLTIMVEDMGVYEVYGAESLGQLGEEVFLLRVRDLLFQEFKKQSFPETNVLQSQQINKILMNHTEMILSTLSKQNSVRVEIPSLYEGVNFTFELTREHFEEYCHDLLDEISRKILKLFNQPLVSFQDVHRVIVTGVSTSHPSVKSSIIDRFFKDLNVSVIDESNLNIGYGDSTAMGTAFMAEEYSKSPPMELFNPTIAPISFGIENSNHQLVKIIHRGLILPNVKSVLLSNSIGFMDSVRFKIYAGECVNDMQKNEELGELILEGIELTEGGHAQIQVSFTLDDNLNLNVTAIDLSTRASSEKVFALEDLEYNNELINRLMDSADDKLIDENQQIGTHLSSFSSKFARDEL